MSVYTEKYADILEANKLAAFIYFTCQGHIFFQAGEEYGRTKFGDGNSYRSDPKVNMMRWHQTVEFADLLTYYEGLISLRKKLPGLYDKSVSAAARVSAKTVERDGVVSFCVDNSAAENASGYDRLFVVFNGNDKLEAVALPAGEWTVLADKDAADCRKKPVLDADGKLIVEALSGVMLGQK